MIDSKTKIEDDVAAIAKRWKTKRGSLIMALHALQDRYGYVPRDAAMSLGAQMDVPLARIYEVLTFYNYFRLEKPGDKVVSVCLGTACYLKGAPQLLEQASNELGIKPGETTKNNEYHLQVVRCVGCCGLAPVVTVNDHLLAKVTPEMLSAQLGKGDAAAIAIAGRPTPAIAAASQAVAKSAAPAGTTHDGQA